MKANEIRLSNWFIGYDYKPFKWEIEHFANLATVYPDEIIKSPIPLTEEILLKAGFKVSMNKTCYGMISESGKTRLSIFHDGLFKVSCEDLEIKVKHLHQLQNLFFALTGEEIKIEL